jgi:peptidoglycan/xylan/chitin deacetylase (PgdA/CDA1 family)/methionyl-tRNA formyltransferase
MKHSDTTLNPAGALRVVLLTALDDSFAADLVKRVQATAGVSLQHVLYLENGSTQRGSGESALVQTCRDLELALQVCQDFSTADAVASLRNLGSQILVTCGTGKLPESIATLPSMGVITLYHGDAPAFNGCPAGFWELWHNRKHSEVTARFSAHGEDREDILLQRSIPICRHDTLRSMEAKMRELTLLVYPKALQTLATGAFAHSLRPLAARQACRPTVAQRLALTVKVHVKRWSLRRWIRLAVRNSGYLAVLALEKVKQVLLQASGSGTLTVLYYHRVSDLCRDPITIGRADFEKQVRYLQRRYHVWSADELKACLQHGGDLHGSRNVLITFDDGYEDNYSNAFPILTKYGSKAIFFISTGLIDTDQRFAHDLQMQPDIQFANMSWTQVQTMVAGGMTIGVHSHSHADLGGLSHEDAVAEINQSMATFRQRLQNEPEWMSFPFGKKDNYTNALIEYVQQSTPMIGLFSADGHMNQGSIRGRIIRRVNIGDGDTGLAFVYKMRGGVRDLFKST